jgi:hypothetical protein
MEVAIGAGETQLTRTPCSPSSIPAQRHDHAAQAECDRRVEIAQVDLGDSALARERARVVEHAVHLPQLNRGPLHQASDTGLDAGVGALEAGGAPQRGRESLAGRGGPSGNYHMSAVGGEQLRRARADAARPAEDDRDPPAQKHRFTRRGR